MSSKPKKSPYSIHPGYTRLAAFINSLPEKTGKTYEEWIRFINENGPSTEQERRDWLKTEHHLGTNFAWWLAESASGKSDEYNPETLVEEMYAGSKAHLRPIYDKLLKLGLKLGRDVKACPCKTMVPLYRKHVFAEIKPSRVTRIDLGLALKDTKPTERLLDTGGLQKKDRITHRIPLTSVKDIDDEVLNWLKTAYDLDA